MNPEATAQGAGVVQAAGGLTNVLNAIIIVVLMGLFFHHLKRIPPTLRVALLLGNVGGLAAFMFLAHYDVISAFFALFIIDLVAFGLIGVRTGSEERRVAELEEQLVNALLILSGSLKAGRSLEQGFDLVQKSLSPPISQEFLMVLQDQGLGMPFDQALKRMLERVSSRDFRLFVTATLFQRETGGNIIALYDEIISSVAERRKVRGKMEAMSIQGKYSGYIIAGLPVAMFGLLSVINPQYVGVFWGTEFPWARTAFVLAVVLEVTGVIAIRGILNRKVG